MTTTPSPSRSRTRLGAAAGLLGVAAALTAVTGLGPVPSAFQLAGVTEDVRGNCDEAEHADDAGCVGTLTARGADDSTNGSTSTTVDGSSTTANPAAPAGADVRTFSAGDAGSVLVQVDGAAMQLLTASPNQGWRVEVERGAGREVEVTFRSGSLRVDLNLELEDGEIRVRVRTRDDATDLRTETENGVVVSDDSSDDNSGPGSDDSGHDSSDDDSADDNSGPGSDDSSSDDSGSDDDSADDNSGSGSDDSGSSDDDSADDNSGSGSDDSGDDLNDDNGGDRDDSVSDDAPGDDNGGDRG